MGNIVILYSLISSASTSNQHHMALQFPGNKCLAVYYYSATNIFISLCFSSVSYNEMILLINFFLSNLLLL